MDDTEFNFVELKPNPEFMAKVSEIIAQSRSYLEAPDNDADLVSIACKMYVLLKELKEDNSSIYSITWLDRRDALIEAWERGGLALSASSALLVSADQDTPSR